MSGLYPFCLVFACGVLASLFFAGPAQAALDRFACNALRVCDQAGACRSGSGTTTFEFEPRKVNRDGEGTYTLRYKDRNFEAYSLSDYGPVLWAEGRNDFQMLTLTGDDTALWQVTDLKAERSVITFLRCSD